MSAATAFYLNLNNKIAKEFKVMIEESDIQNYFVRGIFTDVLKQKLDNSNLSSIKYRNIIKNIDDKSVNRFENEVNKINNTIESSMLETINEYIDDFISHCSMSKSKLIYTNDEDEDIDIKFDVTTLTEDKTEEDDVVIGDGEDDDDIEAKIAQVKPKMQKGIKRQAVFDDEDDGEDEPAQTTSRIASKSTKTTKTPRMPKPMSKMNSKLDIQLDKKPLQLSIMRGDDVIQNYYNEVNDEDDYLNNSKFLELTKNEANAFNKYDKRVITAYGAMFKELAKTEAKSKTKSKGTKTATVTEAEIDKFVKDTLTALEAERNLHNSIENVNKIEIKALHKNFPDVYTVTIVVKNAPAKGSKKTNETQTMCFITNLDNSTKASIIEKYNKKQLNKVTTGSELLKMYTQFKDAVKEDNEESIKAIEDFQTAYIELQNSIAKIKKVKLDLQAFNHTFFYNSKNIYAYSFETSTKHMYPVEALLYKSLNLLTGFLPFIEIDKKLEVISPSNIYKYQLGIAIHSFTKPISARIFETIFNSRFGFINPGETTCTEPIKKAFTQAAANLNLYIEANPKDEIAKYWLNLVQSGEFINAIINNYALSKPFATALKALYTNKSSYKLYIGPLYPISFLFTPFMLKLNVNDIGDKTTIRNNKTDVANIYKKYLDSKAKTISTAFQKEFFEKYSELFMTGDWIYYLTQGEESETLQVMTILYNKFDKGDIKEATHAETEDNTEEEEE